MVGIRVTVAVMIPKLSDIMFKSECATLPVSEIFVRDRRLDAEVYLSEGFTVRRDIFQSKLLVSPLGALAKIWQPSRLKGVRVGLEHGVPFLAGTQVFDIWPEPRKWIAPSRTPDLERRYVAPNWILVTCSGTVGKAIITYSAHTKFIISHDLLRVETHEPETRSYVYAFLRTRFGQAMMRASQYGNVIKHLEVAHLKEIPVPELVRLRPFIHKQITGVFAARDEAYRLDLAARKCFADVMNYRPDVPHEEGYSIAASQMYNGRRRLEAAAYSPSSQMVCQIYERNAQSVVALSTVARVFLPGRFRRIYGATGTTYLDSVPIFRINPDLTKFLTPATKIDFNAYMVRRGWLLMARSGQIYGINGQAILASDWHEGKVITEHIMRIIPDRDKIRSGYLQTVLSHPTLGQPLVVSRAYGTSVPELAPKDIEGLPIPRLKRRVEEKIASMAERASALRLKADNEENDTVASLEKAVQKQLGVALWRVAGGKTRLQSIANP